VLFSAVFVSLFRKLAAEIFFWFRKFLKMAKFKNRASSVLTYLKSHSVYVNFRFFKSKIQEGDRFLPKINLKKKMSKFGNI